MLKKKIKKNKKAKKKEIILFEDGCVKIKKWGTEHFIERLEFYEEKEQNRYTIPSQQYIIVYDTICTMCRQKEPHNYLTQLYDFHGQQIANYFKEFAIPRLKHAKKKYSRYYLMEWIRSY